MCAHARVCVCACVLACVSACVRVCQCVFVCVNVYVCMYVCVLPVAVCGRGMCSCVGVGRGKDRTDSPSRLHIDFSTDIRLAKSSEV